MKRCFQWYKSHEKTGNNHKADEWDGILSKKLILEAIAIMNKDKTMDKKSKEESRGSIKYDSNKESKNRIIQ